MPLNNEWVNNEIEEEIKEFLEANENEHTTTQNLWYTAKAVLRGKFIAMASLRKRKISNKQPNPISTRTRGTSTNKVYSKWKEIIKIRGELNDIDSKNQFQRSMNPGAGSLKR